MPSMNMMAVLQNPYQGPYMRVLCVCSAGCLRSPTAAVVLAQEPFNRNTRSAGVMEGLAIVPVTHTLLEWADEIVCMEEYHAVELTRLCQEYDIDTPIINLGIPDNYSYRAPELMALIKTRYEERSTFKLT